MAPCDEGSEVKDDSEDGEDELDMVGAQDEELDAVLRDLDFRLHLLYQVVVVGSSRKAEVENLDSILEEVAVDMDMDREE